MATNICKRLKQNKQLFFFLFLSTPDTCCWKDFQLQCGREEEGLSKWFDLPLNLFRFPSPPLISPSLLNPLEETKLFIPTSLINDDGYVLHLCSRLLNAMIILEERHRYLEKRATWLQASKWRYIEHTPNQSKEHENVSITSILFSRLTGFYWITKPAKSCKTTTTTNNCCCWCCC